MLKTETKKKIMNLFLLLNKDDLKKNIIQIPKKDEDYEKLNEYLDSIGEEHFFYEVTSGINSSFIQEIGGRASLWHKDPNGNWIILMYNIKKFNK